MFLIGFIAKFGIDLGAETDLDFWKSLGEEIAGQFGAFSQ